MERMIRTLCIRPFMVPIEPVMELLDGCGARLPAMVSGRDSRLPRAA